MKRRKHSGSPVSSEVNSTVNGTLLDDGRISDLLDECTYFCWRCGCLTFRPEEASKPHRGVVCEKCLTEWPRAFKECPECGSFVHLNAPIRWELEEVEHPVSRQVLVRFVEATGTAVCDGCFTCWSYRWEAPVPGSNGTARLEFVGFNYEGRAVRHEYEDAEVIQDS